jgi:alpha-glucosidase
MKLYKWLLPCIFLVSSCKNEVSEFVISSPDSRIKVNVEVGRDLHYSVQYLDNLLIRPSKIALHLGNGTIIGRNVVVSDTAIISVDNTIIPPVKEKRASIPDSYNELILSLNEGFELHIRAYNDGVAYRFAVKTGDSIIIMNEEASFLVNKGTTAYYPQVNKRPDADIFHTAFEEPYLTGTVDSLDINMLAFSPVLLRADDLPNLLITESDLLDYPGMFLTKHHDTGFRGRFAPYPLSEAIVGAEFRQKVVNKRASFICKTAGPRTFPWRVIVIAPDDGDLLLNDLVYRLASPPEFSDFSWIRPGTSTEEWITGLNLYGVDFRAGLNTATYKYYIDIADRFGLEYVMLDAGWSDVNDLFKITPEMDMDEITSYARQKGIGLILWTQALTLERQMDEALEQFKKWDIKIVMTDFIDRDDQQAVNFYQRFARESAERGFMCMIHGAPKPAGFTRTYPHMLAREGALGSEYNIWSSKANPEHDLQIPFIRQVAGPMDYEPGLMQHAGKDHTSKLGFEKVIAQGTRMHQIAMFVVYESPLQLFSGNLSDAVREPQLMQMVGRIPTVWDETRIIEAKFGDYIIEARRNADTWYIAAMNDWQPVEFRVPVSFIGKGKYIIESASDGMNADRNPQDYRIDKTEITSNDTISIRLAPGGGYVAILKEK